MLDARYLRRYLEDDMDRGSSFSSELTILNSIHTEKVRQIIRKRYSPLHIVIHIQRLACVIVS